MLRSIKSPLGWITQHIHGGAQLPKADLRSRLCIWILMESVGMPHRGLAAERLLDLRVCGTRLNPEELVVVWPGLAPCSLSRIANILSSRVFGSMRIPSSVITDGAA